VTVGSGAASATPATRDEPEPARRRLSARNLLVAAALVAAVVVVLLVAGVFSGGGTSSPTRSAGGSPATASGGSSGATKSTPGASMPSPANTPVAVLNGTTITGLAAKAADQLTSAGYPIGTKTDAADQAQQTSQVAYATGFKTSARKIAQILGISSRQVVPIDPSTRAVAGSNADVVVTMGADKAQ
jgi:hypothetical protein